MTDILLILVLAVAIVLAMPRARVDSLVLRAMLGIGQSVLALAMAAAVYAMVVIIGSKLSPPSAGIPPAAARPAISL